MDHIILEGFIGSGKAGIGKKIARDMSLHLFEVDKMISEKVKMSSADLYEKFGETYIRALETAVLNDLRLLDERAVIIVGADLPQMPFNDEYLEKLGRVYWVRATKEQIIEKVSKTKKYAALQKDGMEAHLKEMLAEREPGYARAADHIIDMTGKTADEAAREIEALAKEAPVKKKGTAEAPKKRGRKSTK